MGAPRVLQPPIRAAVHQDCRFAGPDLRQRQPAHQHPVRTVGQADRREARPRNGSEQHEPAPTSRMTRVVVGDLRVAAAAFAARWLPASRGPRVAAVGRAGPGTPTGIRPPHAAPGGQGCSVPRLQGRRSNRCRPVAPAGSSGGGGADAGARHSGGALGSPPQGKEIPQGIVGVEGDRRGRGQGACHLRVLPFGGGGGRAWVSGALCGARVGSCVGPGGACGPRSATSPATTQRVRPGADLRVRALASAPGGVGRDRRRAGRRCEFCGLGRQESTQPTLAEGRAGRQPRSAVVTGGGRRQRRRQLPAGPRARSGMGQARRELGLPARTLPDRDQSPGAIARSMPALTRQVWMSPSRTTMASAATVVPRSARASSRCNARAPSPAGSPAARSRRAPRRYRGNVLGRSALRCRTASRRMTSTGWGRSRSPTATDSLSYTLSRLVTSCGTDRGRPVEECTEVFDSGPDRSSAR